MQRYLYLPFFLLGLMITLAVAGGSTLAADVRLHGEPPETNHTLSPDGTRMIVLQARKGRRHYNIVNTRTGEDRDLLDRSFVAMSWGEDSNTAWGLKSDGSLFRLSFRGKATEVTPVALTGKSGIPSTSRRHVIGYPNALVPFLFVRAAGRIYRCSLVPEAGAIAARCEVADSDARPGLFWAIEPGGRLSARIVRVSPGEREFQARTEEGNWRPVFRYTFGDTVLTFIGGPQKDRTLWALSDRGRTHAALVKLNIETGHERIIHERRGDATHQAALLFDELGEGSPLLAGHFPGYQEVVHFERRVEAAYRALREKLGHRIRIDFKSMDPAGNSVVVEASSPEIYKRWYLLDVESRESRLLSAGTVAGYERPAEPSRPVSFMASDGLALHGYLTLPGRQSDPSPMLLMLHGGPWVRDFWPSPAIVRFLGSLGYAVLRLNYRGSTGYGRQFQEAGRAAVFGRLQQDVRDAARWAVARGYTAEGQVALYGGSFGGFLALTTLASQTNAYRAGITVNAFTDAVSFWRRDWRHADTRALWSEFLASRDFPEAALARISPVNKIRNFDTPVLLLAGTQDRRVPVEHSFELFDLLRDAGKPADLVEYRSLGHNLWGANQATREHIAGRIADFLATHLPIRPPD